MPTIKVEWIEGRTIEQKRELSAEITKLVARVAKTGSERVKVEFHDIPKTNIAWNGVLRCDEELKNNTK
jgi:4-oxalocrotonate tautomerase